MRPERAGRGAFASTVAGALCVSIAGMLIFGSLKLYGLEREIRDRQRRIAGLQEQVGVLGNQLICSRNEALRQAEEMGMALPDEYVILHVGRGGSDS